MDKRILITVAMVGIALLLLPSEDLLAQTTQQADAALDSKINAIRSFVFGLPMKFVALLGAAYGMVKSIGASSPVPFITFAGIALGATLAPTFLDSVHNLSGMLLP